MAMKHKCPKFRGKAQAKATKLNVNVLTFGRENCMRTSSTTSDRVELLALTCKLLTKIKHAKCYLRIHVRIATYTQGVHAWRRKFYS